MSGIFAAAYCLDDTTPVSSLKKSRSVYVKIRLQSGETNLSKEGMEARSSVVSRGVVRMHDYNSLLSGAEVYTSKDRGVG